ncbi:MAG TPA: DUF1940 domain-containing protein [Thermoplasmataceae archaeon]|nr:DUF1940 domain-containing protein [Thermoplasmataceae archaeon]
MALNPENEDFSTAFCTYTESALPRGHPIFKFDNEIKLAEAFLGLAVSEGVRLNETRELLDMLDTLYQNLTDPNSKLPDQQRKGLNHEEEVWLDMKDKMNRGDRRSAFLLASHAHLSNAISFLLECKSMAEFKDIINDYQVKYLSKLSIRIYREAIGHVML